MTVAGGSLTAALGMRIVSVTGEEATVEWDVAPMHQQPMGIVHGGTHCTAIETACSLGASAAAHEREPGMVAVGLENHTSFVRAVRGGTLRAIATPVTRGRRSQLWEAVVTDSGQRIIARGTVRLLNVAADAAIGGALPV